MGLWNFTIGGKQNTTYTVKLSITTSWMRNFPSRMENTYLSSNLHNNDNKIQPSHGRVNLKHRGEIKTSLLVLIWNSQITLKSFITQIISYCVLRDWLLLKHFHGNWLTLPMVSERPPAIKTVAVITVSKCWC